MSLSSLCLFFFAISVGAFAPTEASSVRVAVNTPAAASPVTFALLADQHQPNNKRIPVQKESSGGLPQQRKTRLANILATAGTAAVLMAFVFVFMKAYLAKEREEEEKEVKHEDVVDQPKKESTPEEKLEKEKRIIAGEIGFDDEMMTAKEIEIEARRRIQRREEKYEQIRAAAGAEGRTELELWKAAYRSEGWERKQARGKRYGYEPDPVQFIKEFEEDWKEKYEEDLKKELRSRKEFRRRGRINE